jgi:hypothetical protein
VDSGHYDGFGTAVVVFWDSGHVWDSGHGLGQRSWFGTAVMLLVDSALFFSRGFGLLGSNIWVLSCECAPILVASVQIFPGMTHLVEVIHGVALRQECVDELEVFFIVNSVASRNHLKNRNLIVA